MRSEKPDWAVTGCEGREQRILSSIYIKPEEEEVANYRMMQNWNRICENEVRYREYYLDDAEIVWLVMEPPGALPSPRSELPEPKAFLSVCYDRLPSALPIC
jgi:hypothetical protein